MAPALRPSLLTETVPLADGPVSVAEFLRSLYDARYTGTITLHWHNGVPKQVDFPGPSLKLDARKDT